MLDSLAPEGAGTLPCGSHGAPELPRRHVEQPTLRLGLRSPRPPRWRPRAKSRWASSKGSTIKSASCPGGRVMLDSLAPEGAGTLPCGSHGAPELPRRHVEQPTLRLGLRSPRPPRWRPRAKSRWASSKGSTIKSASCPGGRVMLDSLAPEGAGALPAAPQAFTRPATANTRQKSSATARKKAGSLHVAKGGLPGKHRRSTLCLIVIIT